VHTLEGLTLELINHLGSHPVNILHIQVVRIVANGIILHKFVFMNNKSYFSVGSAPQNDLHLTADGVQPFHLILLLDEHSEVFVSTVNAAASFTVDQKSHSQLLQLEPMNELSVGGQIIDWRRLFNLPTMSEVPQNEPSPTPPIKKKALNIQLLLIYSLVIALLLLLAFYI